MFRRFFKKRRKYPIILDDNQHSARARAFQLYDQDPNLTYKDIAKALHIREETARHYYYEHKNLPRDFKNSVRLLKLILKSDPRKMQEMVEDYAKLSGKTIDQVLSDLQQPYAYKRMILFYWRKDFRINQYKALLNKLKAAIDMIYVHECLGIPSEKILDALEKLRKEYELE